MQRRINRAQIRPFHFNDSLKIVSEYDQYDKFLRSERLLNDVKYIT